MSNKMKSPFGLFVRKMRFEDQCVQNMPFSECLNHCDRIYKKLDPSFRQMLEKLSQDIRQLALNDKDINYRLKRMDINWDEMKIKTEKSDDKTEENKVEIPLDVIKSKPKTTESMVKGLDVYSRVKSALNSVQDLESMSIIIISFNIMVKTFEGNYYPNEIGIIGLTLKDGIENVYHNNISNEIPSGYYARAREHSLATHKMPLSQTVDYVKDYELLFSQIHDFLSASDLIDSFGKKLVFCGSVDKNGNEDNLLVLGCLEWLTKQINKPNMDFSGFQVIELSELLALITKPYISRPITLIRDDLSNCVYDYFRSINCEFHEMIENTDCALGRVKRLAYLFFDQSLELLKIEPKLTHKPPEQINAVIESYVSFEKKPYSRQHLFTQSNCHSDEDSKEGLKELIKKTENLLIEKDYNQMKGIGRGRSRFRN